jgi:hypothetical protein
MLNSENDGLNVEVGDFFRILTGGVNAEIARGFFEDAALRAPRAG